MPNTIAELRETVAEYEQRVTNYAEAGEIDRAHEATGALAAYREMLLNETQRVEEENARLAEQMQGLSNPSRHTVGELALGARDAFDGIAPGWKAKVSLAMATMATISNAATTLPTPTYEDNNLPGLVRPPMGFLDTIARGTTNGDEKYFLPPALTNAAAGWTTGTNKPESGMAWTEHTSNLETIAHWIPVHKQMVRRYNTLESQISKGLMLGLAMKRAEMVLKNDNSNGIIGALNFPGILEFTKNASDNIVDTLADMATRCRIASGYSPNYVALSPNAIRAIAKTKAEDGHYLFPNFKAGDTVPGTNMIAVEDQNMTIVTGEEPSQTTTEGALVYFSGVCTYKVADPDQVEIGLTDKQFIQNAYTLLGEGTGLLRIDAPAALCYCADLGITVKSE